MAAHVVCNITCVGSGGAFDCGGGKWNRGFEVVRRYEKLREFFKEHHLKEEAAWIANRLKKIVPHREKILR
ncbi:MAG: hypothetical protein HWN51_00775 [Desulfobacterales bacterium]|nr:hypothetical protein [Desulfobacterales bacterium]